jgi:hypothetical protein
LTVAERDAVVKAVQVWLSAMLTGSSTAEDDPDSLSSS